MKWECIAITLDDYQKFLETIRRSTDADEKVLRKRITDEILPVMEEQAEKQRQKALKRQREAENLQKLATAKRSSRLAGKKELEKQREEAKAAEKQELADLAMARKEQEKQRQMEEVRPILPYYEYTTPPAKPISTDPTPSLGSRIAHAHQRTTSQGTRSQAHTARGRAEETRRE